MSVLKELFAYLQESGKFDIEFNVIFKDVGSEVETGEHFVQVRVDGRVLQWFEDSLPEHCFVVRDYGLVLMKRDSVPPGALLLDDFRKEAPKAKEEKK